MSIEYPHYYVCFLQSRFEFGLGSLWEYLYNRRELWIFLADTQIIKENWPFQIADEVFFFIVHMLEMDLNLYFILWKQFSFSICCLKSETKKLLEVQTKLEQSEFVSLQILNANGIR